MKGSPFTLKASFDVSDRQSKKCLRCGAREAALSLCHISPTPLTAMFVHLSTLFLSFLGPFFCIFLYFIYSLCSSQFCISDVSVAK